MQFYVCRLEDDDYVENINVGDLAGTLWYLHNEATLSGFRLFDSVLQDFRSHMSSKLGLAVHGSCGHCLGYRCK